MKRVPGTKGVQTIACTSHLGRIGRLVSGMGDSGHVCNRGREGEEWHEDEGFEERGKGGDEMVI